MCNSAIDQWEEWCFWSCKVSKARMFLLDITWLALDTVAKKPLKRLLKDGINFIEI